MNDKEILEGNKLIAEFMAVEVIHGPDWDRYNMSDGTGMTSQCLHYHEDWNWLMPVVEDVEYMLDTMLKLAHEGDDSIEFFYKLELENLKFIEDSIFVSTDISKVYKDVLEFIKWYNSNNPTNEQR